MLNERISIQITLAEEALRWLEVLADTNPDPQLMATIETLALRIEGWRRLEFVTQPKLVTLPPCPNPTSSSR